MSYIDGPQQRRPHRRDDSHRAPYPDYDHGVDKSHGMNDAYPPPSYTAGAARPAAPNGLGTDEHLPPPPIGETLKPALKRAGSRSRLTPDDRPSFPDEASYLGGRAPDLEAKNRPRDQRFRDLRDGYESDEGEAHKLRATKEKAAHGSRRMPRGRDEDDAAYDDRKRRPRRGGSDYPPPDSAVSSRGGRDYDDPPPRRSRRDPYEDDYPPPRRRGDRPPPGVEYGAEPVPSRMKSDRRPRRRDYDDYSDEEDDRRPRRPRSVENHRRRPRDYDDGPYYLDEPRRRRDEYDPPARRRDRSRRRDDDYDDYYDDRRDRDRRGNKVPKEIKIGKYDIGPWVEKGQKHWTTVAPIVTPFIMNYVRKNMGGGGKR